MKEAPGGRSTVRALADVINSVSYPGGGIHNAMMKVSQATTFMDSSQPCRTKRRKNRFGSTIRGQRIGCDNTHNGLDPCGGEEGAEKGAQNSDFQTTKSMERGQSVPSNQRKTSAAGLAHLHFG